MPVAKNRVDPRVAQRYLQSRGSVQRSEVVAQSIATNHANNKTRMDARRTAMVAHMQSGGLCKSI